KSKQGKVSCRFVLTFKMYDNLWLGSNIFQSPTYVFDETSVYRVYQTIFTFPFFDFELFNQQTTVLFSSTQIKMNAIQEEKCLQQFFGVSSPNEHFHNFSSSSNETIGADFLLTSASSLFEIFIEESRLSRTNLNFSDRKKFTFRSREKEFWIPAMIDTKEAAGYRLPSFRLTS
ncbi:MAG: hypothetical protein AAGK05_17970, partial [Pseudomonadota bacterium]